MEGKQQISSTSEKPKDAQDFGQAALALAQQRSEIYANNYRRQPEKFRVGHKILARPPKYKYTEIL